MKPLWIRKARIAAAVALLGGASVAWANNLQISNVSLVDAGLGEVDIQFDLSWDNSWHETWTEDGGTITVTNWDAVWVFVKYRQNGGLWKHVMLDDTGHTATGGTAITVADDGDGRRLGAFVHRTAAGSGTVTCTGMKLHWNLAAAGLPATQDIDLMVMGIEMVYIPEGAFSLGSGGTESNPFQTGSDSSVPYYVGSEAAIPLGNGPGELYSGAGLPAGTLPAEFPKGYAAFYCMKYEISEGQYTDFLNLLDPAVAATYWGETGWPRYTIVEASGGGYETSTSDRACAYLDDIRLMTYFDWCGLRPMTELEYEKACRGPAQPWVNEYAWGNTSYTILTGFTGTDGSGTETPSPAGANCHFSTSGVNGAVRCGIFADASATRQSAGASYYGVMELSGNLYEMAVGVSNPAGHVFTDTYGDGNEYSPVLDQWPGENSYAYGHRGGSFGYYGIPFSRTSDRAGANTRYRDITPESGGRGVRRAP